MTVFGAAAAAAALAVRQSTPLNVPLNSVFSAVNCVVLSIESETAADASFETFPVEEKESSGQGSQFWCESRNVLQSLI